MTAIGTPRGSAPRSPESIRQERILWAAVAFLAAAAIGSTAVQFQATPVLLGGVTCFVIVAYRETLLAWRTLLGVVLLTILFIPIRRYTIGGGLPISLEPYRLIIAVVLMGWGGALLVDPKVRWRPTIVDRPIAALFVSVVAGLALNIGWISSTGITSEVIKQLSFFVSFLLVMYFVASTMSSRESVDRIVKVLVFGGTFVAIAGLIEWKTHNNLFNYLQRGIPILQLDPSAIVGPPARGGRVRAYASAQHPIALGAMLVLLMPLAVYLYWRTTKLVWMGCAGLMTMGALATGSRTAATMLVAELLVFFWLKRQETVRLLPMLLPLVLVCQIAMPGTLGTFRAILFPEKGLISEQQGAAGTSGSGRIADLGPSLKIWWRKPWLGQGFGSRLTSETDKKKNADILDNEWLSMLLKVGLIGILALAWMYVRAVRALGRLARSDTEADGKLAACLAAGITSFAIGMITFDAFSFIQVTFLSFILIGLGSVLISLQTGEGRDLSQRPAEGLADGRAGAVPAPHATA